MTSNIGKRFVTMTDDEKTRSGIAAYDCGEYQILSNTLIDYYTNGNDFSSDVLSRAEFFLENGFWFILIKNWRLDFFTSGQDIQLNWCTNISG